MKHFKIKKSDKPKKRKPFIKEGVLTSLSKPKLPLSVIWFDKKSNHKAKP